MAIGNWRPGRFSSSYPVRIGAGAEDANILLRDYRNPYTELCPWAVLERTQRPVAYVNYR